MSVLTFPGSGYDCNVYVIPGDRAILIDTTSGLHSDRLLGKLKERMDVGTIRTIILTHRHFDHIGGAPFFTKELDAEVFVHELDAEAVRSGDARATGAEMFGVSSLGHLSPSILKGNETLSTGTSELQVIHTPGHSAGSICLFDKDERSLICGDTIFADGVGRWDLPSGDLRALRSSIRGLSQLNVERLYPGHGPPVMAGAKERISNILLTQVGE